MLLLSVILFIAQAYFWIYFINLEHTIYFPAHCFVLLIILVCTVIMFAGSIAEINNPTSFDVTDLL